MNDKKKSENPKDRGVSFSLLTNDFSEEKKKKKPLKADYKGATPDQVAQAVLSYRPKKSR